MKMKRNKITIVTLIFSIIMMTVLPLPSVIAANFTVSKNSVTLENGKSTTITINASTHTGRLDISSSNPGIVAVDTSNVWVENNSKTITISSNSIGSAKITIKGELFDESTEEEKEFSQTINVTVIKAPTSTNTVGSSSGGSQSSGTTGSTSNNQSSNSGSTSNSSKPSSSSTVSKPSSSSTSSKPTTDSNLTSKPLNNVMESSPSHNISNMNNEVDLRNESQSEIDIISQDESVDDNILEQGNKVESQVQENNIAENDISKGKLIILTLIAIIAVGIIFIGIGVSKNILKK